MWLMENLTDNTVFDSSFTYKFNNLTFSDPNNEETLEDGQVEWKVLLNPGGDISRKIVLIDPTQKWGYRYNFQFKCYDYILKEEKLLRMIREDGK
jgi:hypothetical protein